MKKIVKWFGLSTGAALLVVGGIALALYLIINANGVTQQGYLYIPTGGTYQGVLDSLAKDNRVKNVKWFGLAAKISGMDDKVRPGRYSLEEGMSNLTLALNIKRGLQEPVKLTFNNIRTIERLAAVVGRKLECDSSALVKVLKNDSVAAANGFTTQTFIAMFLPDTYEFYWNTSPNGFVKKMRAAHDSFWTSERREKLTKIGLNETEAVTLASIVCEETRKTDEMPRVAGVYLNRLRIGMPLQADPTVKFAIGDFTLRRIYNSHLKFVSPYNTYINKGLPPGPIAMPAKTVIDAVLDAENHKYIYFCARADFSGYHSFAASYAEHQKNARAYARALNARNIK